MSEHQILGAMLVLQTVAIALGFAYLARVLTKVSEDTRQIMQALERIAARLG